MLRNPAMPTTSTSSSLAGLGIAILSAAAFGASGPFAKALLDAGWSPGAAVLVRVGLATVLLAPVVIRAWSRRRPSGGDLRFVTLYGAIAVAGAQLCFFSAVQTLSVGVALLLEYTAPVLLVGYAWLRTGRPPGRSTALGSVLALVGLVLVLDLRGDVSVDPVGVLWGLAAAVCLSTYFQLSAQADDDLPPLVMAGAGLATGTVAILALGVTGVMPIVVTTQPVLLLGAETSWLVPGLILSLVCALVAYVTGVEATMRLGSRIASFVGLTEVLFAVLFSWALLGQLPVAIQLVGGLCILGGVALVQADRTTDLTADRTAGDGTVEPARGGEEPPAGERRPTDRPVLGATAV